MEEVTPQEMKMILREQLLGEPQTPPTTDDPECLFEDLVDRINFIDACMDLLHDERKKAFSELCNSMESETIIVIGIDQ